MKPLPILLLCALAAPASADDGFVPLFDGKTLGGWRQVGGTAKYRVENGEIVGEVDPAMKGNAFLMTEKTYGDFILKLDYKLEVPGNSGIQFRSHQRPSKDGNGRVFGYQAEVDPSPRAWSAGLYDEARRAWLYPLAGHPEAQKAYRPGEWNSLVIEARGPRIRTTLNGIICADDLDAMDLEGFIALQVHVGKAGLIRWKDIRIRDLGRSEWKPLWDGKTLEGWDPAGGGHWAIEDGVIHGTNTSGDPRHGHLFSKDEYGDFAVRLKFQAKQGNSGLYFRAEEAGSLGIKGFQAEIDPLVDIGGLYETEGRGWVVKPKAEEIASWLKPNQFWVEPGWTDLTVIAIGDRVVARVNGFKSAEVVDPIGRKRGKFALQLHGSQDVDVRFKDLMILPIATEK